MKVRPMSVAWKMKWKKQLQVQGKIQRAINLKWEGWKLR